MNLKKLAQETLQAQAEISRYPQNNGAVRREAAEFLAGELEAKLANGEITHFDIAETLIDYNRI